MNDARTAVVTAGRRTPIGTAGGALADVEVADLAAPLIRILAQDVDGGLDGGRIDEVILGNCLGPGGNIARSAALAAGLDPRVPSVTVDRQCGSGLEAVAQAAALIGSGRAATVLAGGAESASTAPWRYWPPSAEHPEPRRYSRAPFAPQGFPDPSMGEAADLVAAHLGIDRVRQDAWAQRSHSLAHAAVTTGVFTREILPLPGLDHDQRPRAGMTTARLSRLPPAFSADGTATAGNSCGISDGAALLTVTTGGPGLAIRGIATVGGDPGLPGMAAGQAIRTVLGTAGMTTGDLDAVEITEAFAAVALATIDLAGLDPATVCSDGGAIGYGHPWGASGAVLLVRLLHRMERDDHTVGVAACAIGGGQGIAVLVERVGWSMPEIQFRGVGHVYGDRVVLDGIDLRFTESRIGIVGGNGSGKSTLARMINGLVLPTSGTVSVDGSDTARDGKGVRAQVGFVFTDPDNQIVMPTVQEDVAFSLRRSGLPAAERTARVRETLQRFGLTEYADHPPHLLSGGQKQLLALAAVLVRGPRVLVADEPTTLLDLRNARMVGELLAGLDEQVVLVTHHLDLLEDFDRVVVIDRGRVAADDGPAPALAAYRALLR